jgi:purine operon repressor
MLTRSPGRLLPLTRLAHEQGVAKSTLSEDLSIVARAFREEGLGEVVSTVGASGGVLFRPRLSSHRVRALAEDLSAQLRQEDRRIPGGFLFTSDLVFSPEVAQAVGEVFASCLWDRSPDAVVTVETKGIPLALMTAHFLGRPLVTVRRDSRVTEGPALGINYVSGSSRIQTMSLPRRALPPGSRVLLVDDFLKGGGTARGMMDLMREFGARVVGTAVFMETERPPQKMVEDYLALLTLTADGDVRPSDRLAAYLPPESLGTEGTP